MPDAQKRLTPPRVHWSPTRGLIISDQGAHHVPILSPGDLTEMPRDASPLLFTPPRLHGGIVILPEYARPGDEVRIEFAAPPEGPSRPLSPDEPHRFIETDATGAPLNPDDEDALEFTTGVVQTNQKALHPYGDPSLYIDDADETLLNDSHGHPRRVVLLNQGELSQALAALSLCQSAYNLAKNRLSEIEQAKVRVASTELRERNKAYGRASETIGRLRNEVGRLRADRRAAIAAADDLSILRHPQETVRTDPTLMALCVHLLKAQGGSVTISQAEEEALPAAASIKAERQPDGTFRASIDEVRETL
jgi:hypothetical protein